MIRDETHLRQLSEAFVLSAVQGDWREALSGLAEACGGRAAELIGLGAQAGLAFHTSSGLDPAAITEFVETAGWDPRRNPRVKAGLRCAELEVLSESDYASPEELWEMEIYADQFARLDIPFILQTNLLRGRRNVVGLSVLRSARQGPPDAEQRDAFAALAAAAQAAARMQLVLEGQGAALMAGAFEAMEMAAYVCDADGVVKAMSGPAEALAASSSHLTLSAGRLRARGASDASVLSLAIARASVSGSAPTELAIRCPQGGPPMLLQVARLPAREFSLGLEATVLVLARPQRDAARRGALLQTVFHLTPAEAQVALALGDGASAELIAARRGVSIGTVRAQIKVVFSKLGVRRQAEVAARLAFI